jgi:type II secretory pathway pseudopilin PulG
MTERVMMVSYLTIVILVAMFAILLGGLYLNMQVLRTTQASAALAQAEAAEAAREAAQRAQYPPVTDYLDIRDLRLVRDEGRLWVVPDIHSGRPFEGRFRVALRDETGRHYFTPQWSGWQSYLGPQRLYRERETMMWWAALDGPVQAGVNGAWAMETCWELRERVPDDGMVALGALCAETELEAAQ